MLQLEEKKSDAEVFMGLTYEKSNPGKENVQKSDSTGKYVQKSTPVGGPVHSQVSDLAAQEELLYSEEPEQVLGSVKEIGLLMSSLIHSLFLIVNHNFFYFYSIAFTPLFSEFRKTKYAEKFSLANGLK